MAVKIANRILAYCFIQDLIFARRESSASAFGVDRNRGHRQRLQISESSVAQRRWLKLIRCPRSLAPTLVALLSMSLIPSAPFRFSQATHLPLQVFAANTAAAAKVELMHRKRLMIDKLAGQETFGWTRHAWQARQVFSTAAAAFCWQKTTRSANPFSDLRNDAIKAH
jgi:hypothetical protein